MGGLWWMGAWWLLVVIGIGVLVYVAVRLASRSGDGKPSGGGDAAAPGQAKPSTARQILEERLARGEIDSDEFRDRMRALDGQ
ncbi:SHOCT domain-containing protein [Demequina sp.]|uniref:SHOCT domain-containing protein n=1 Tax=Demequina sp. TaxID=2050685 RepID=UPI0025BDDCD3|nr:SHOCT domain-containing protein [Demequina sp.]